jgi:glycosyltransferase involved in cell wall biosynthesis
MKITFVAPSSHFSGGVKVVAIYAERLQNLGHEVVVVSPAHPVPTLRKRVRSVMRGGHWFQRNDLSHFTGRPIDVRIYRPHRPVEDRDVPDADVIISTWFETAFWIDKLSPAKGAKVAFIQGYETLPEEPRPEIDDAWRLPFQKIVISQWLKDLAVEKFGDTHAAHVPNSVDTAQFFAPPRGMQAVPTVGFLSNQSPFKGMKTALSALTKMRETIPNLRLVSFGHEVTHGELKLPPGSEFHFLPPQNTIRDLYAKCDVWLCGSQREGFHLPPLEAMACRCPVVSTRVGGPEDIIVPGKNGYLVERGDAQGLAEAATRLLTGGEENWKRFSDAALATATGYTWDDATARFEAALQTAVARAARGEIRGGRKSPAAAARAEAP